MPSAQRIVLFLLALSLLAGAITGSSLYYRLSYLWVFLLVGSWIMSVLALRGIRVERTARTLRSQVGQIFEERFRINNPGRLPRLWVEVRDESPLPGSRGSHVLTLIGGREARTYLARTRLVERGVFPLGPTELVSGDLFGLFPVSRVFPSQESLLVYPMMFDIGSFPNPPGLLPGGEALRRRTNQITSNAAGVREYAPGDPLNRIHWTSTARRDRLIVKEFELDPLAEVWIFVDGARSVQASEPDAASNIDPQDIWRSRVKFSLPPFTAEYAVSAAASLGRYYLGRGRAVGLATSGSSFNILPSDRGGRQLGKILEMLAIFRAEGVLPLSDLIETQARHLPRGSTVVVITPSASNDVILSSDILLRRGLRPILILVDAISFGGYFSNEKLVPSLLILGIPVYRLCKGDDITKVLSAESLLPAAGG
jgi:uncharacterized protein (DUF58 family)